MFKVLCLTIIVGITLRATRADDATKESQCIEEIVDELQGYVRSEVWQELFKRHYKFIVNENGKILSERKGLKFNTIIHNALYGCNHERDDEIDDCPNISRKQIKSCKHALNLRAAMFRTARCKFVELTVKHLVLSDILLDTFPLEKLDEIAELADRPIREFGGPVANMLSVLAHGETDGGLAELMAVNLYLNNAYGTALMHRAPPDGPARTAAELSACRARARRVHGRALAALRAFRDTWCGDRDVDGGHEAAAADGGHEAAAEAIRDNADDAERLLRGLNVAGGAAVARLDFAPERVALAAYTGRLVDGRFAGGALAAALRAARFEATYEFDPRALYGRYLRGTVFRAVYACFYWTAAAHARLADRLAGLLLLARVPGADGARAVAFADAFGRFARPLAAFRVAQSAFADPLSPAALRTVTHALRTVVRAHRLLRRAAAGPPDRARRVLRAVRPAVRALADRLDADVARAVPGATHAAPPRYFARLDADAALRLMRSNCRAAARLVAVAGGHAEDRANLVRLRRFFFYSSEAVAFDHGPDH